MTDRNATALTTTEQHVVKYRNAGYSHKEISHAVGLSISEVKQVLKRLGLNNNTPHPRPVVDSLTEQRIVELYEDGHTAHDIASELGIPKMTVGPVIRKHCAHAHRMSSEEVQQILETQSSGFDTPRGNFVYLLLESQNSAAPLYVGRSRNIMGRLGQHLITPAKRDHFNYIRVIRCDDYDQMCSLEATLIEMHKPPLNVAGC